MDNEERLGGQNQNQSRNMNWINEKMDDVNWINETMDDEKYIRTLIWVGVAFLLFSIALYIFYCILQRHRSSKKKSKRESHKRGLLKQNQILKDKLAELEQCVDYTLDDCEIDKKDLYIFTDQMIGAGAFSNVYKGRLTALSPACNKRPSKLASKMMENCDVAVKLAPEFWDKESKKDFIKEINFMKTLGSNKHVLGLLGCVSDGNNPVLVLEYCMYGDLLKFVRSRKDQIQSGTGEFSEKSILSIFWQIADGMDYLSTLKIVHRDVAARNVLIAEGYQAKISDFGLCRNLDQYTYTTTGGRLPIKWMAIESLETYEYSTKSDVWSYGVLLWEVLSLGDVPFRYIEPTALINHLKTGNRLERPQLCPEDFYDDIMLKCWHEDSSKRPDFSALRGWLAMKLEAATEHYGYLTVVSTANANVAKSFNADRGDNEYEYDFANC